MRVLIVDDQTSVHRYMNNVIDWKAMKVREVQHAFDGAEALDAIKQTHPDLVLLDIKMPQMDGLQLIEELARLRIKQRIVILSAYNEFEYARQALRFGVKDYLLKPIDSKKLSSVISSIAGEIENEKGLIIHEMLSAIIYGYKPGDNIYKAFCKIMDDMNARQFFCMYFYCRNSSPENIMEELGRHLKNKVIKNNPGICVNKDEYILIGSVCQEEETYRTECNNLLEAICEFRRERPAADIVVGVSNTSGNIDDLKELCQKAREAVKLAFYSSEDAYYYSNSLFANRIDNAALDTLSKDVLECIRMNYYEFKCIDSIKNYFDYFRKNKISKDVVLLTCKSLIAVINEKLLREYRGKNIFMEEMAEELTSAVTDINRLEMEFSRRFFVILGRIRSQRPKTDIDIVREIKAYVDENYHEDLSLDSISERFFISKYQLSRVFKKEIGVNYWDYVTKVRMETAGSLIRNSGNKIYEIAEKVGYEDISYFSTNFKKYFGKSPKDYKSALTGSKTILC